MQQEESMDEILSSIRRILSSEIEAGKEKKKTAAKPVKKDDPAKPEKIEKKIAVLVVEPADPSPAGPAAVRPFVLTPAMRVDAPVSVTDKVIREINVEKLETCENELKPYVKAWLDENLPDVVEKVVRDEVVRVLAQIRK